MEFFASIFASLMMMFSLISGAFSNTVAFIAEPLTLRQARATVLFGGDMMFDRSIRIASAEKGQDFILACLDPVFEQADLVVANLEGPITSEPSVSVGSTVSTPENFTFTFPVGTAALLARHGIELVNLGNNHIENFGAMGVRSTMELLNAADVQHFGDTLEQSVAQVELHGVRLAFVNFNQFAQSSTKAKTIAQIEAAREGGEIVVVYAHWGDEYVEANQYQKDLAHAFIDAGAEIVIGSHPHVIQEHEVYAGKHIYYSLGNLVFDQYWNDDVRTGLLVSVLFDRRGVVSVEESRTYLQRDRSTCPAAAN